MSQDNTSSLLAKLFSVVVLWVSSVALGWLTLIYGWGLHIVSWPWIIGGSFGGLVIYIMITALSK